MVALSNRLAKEAGVAGKATFIEGDMFTADISKASVMALFLLPDNLERAARHVLEPAARHAAWCSTPSAFPSGTPTRGRPSPATA